jgi:hypothetical protein
MREKEEKEEEEGEREEKWLVVRSFRIEDKLRLIYELGGASIRGLHSALKLPRLSVVRLTAGNRIKKKGIAKSRRRSRARRNIRTFKLSGRCGRRDEDFLPTSPKRDFPVHPAQFKILLSSSSSLSPSSSLPPSLSLHPRPPRFHH